MIDACLKIDIKTQDKVVKNSHLIRNSSTQFLVQKSDATTNASGQ